MNINFLYNFWMLTGSLFPVHEAFCWPREAGAPSIKWAFFPHQCASKRRLRTLCLQGQSQTCRKILKIYRPNLFGKFDSIGQSHELLFTTNKMTRIANHWDSEFSDHILTFWPSSPFHRLWKLHEISPVKWNFVIIFKVAFTCNWRIIYKWYKTK